MALMNADLYDALKEAGVSEQKSRQAAISVANYESRIAKVESGIEILKYMVGTNILITLGVLWKVIK